MEDCISIESSKLFIDNEVADLWRLIDAKELFVRMNAVKALANLSQNNEIYTNDLLLLVEHGNIMECKKAIVVLSYMNNPCRKILDVLTTMLKHDDLRVQYEAAEAFCEIGQGNDGTIDSLVAMVENGCDGFLQWTAAEALGRIAQGNKQRINMLMKREESWDSSSRMCFHNALNYQYENMGVQ